MDKPITGTFAPGDNAINETYSDSGWHLLAEKTFQEGEGSTDQFARQVEALLSIALAMLNLPVALLQTISTQLIQVVTHSGRANPSKPVSIRVYIQKLEDPAYHSGGNGWGYFLVDRNVIHPGLPTEVFDYLIEIYLYSEGERRDGDKD